MPVVYLIAGVVVVLATVLSWIPRGVSLLRQIEHGDHGPTLRKVAGFLLWRSTHAVMLMIAIGLIGYSVILELSQRRMAAWETNTSVRFARPEPKGGFPYAVNTPVWLRATVSNHGSETAHQLVFAFYVDAVARPATREVEDAIWKITEAKAAFNIVKSQDDLGKDDYRFVDAFTPALSAEDIATLRSASSSLFATGIARYTDHAGVLISEICVHLVPGSDTQQPLVWRRCENHNRVGVVP